MKWGRTAHETPHVLPRDAATAEHATTPTDATGENYLTAQVVDAVRSCASRVTGDRHKEATSLISKQSGVHTSHAYTYPRRWSCRGRGRTSALHEKGRNVEQSSVGQHAESTRAKRHLRAIQQCDNDTDALTLCRKRLALARAASVTSLVITSWYQAITATCTSSTRSQQLTAASSLHLL